MIFLKANGNLKQRACKLRMDIGRTDLAKGGEHALENRLVHALRKVGHVQLGVIIVVQAGAGATIETAGPSETWLGRPIRTDAHHQCSAVHSLQAGISGSLSVHHRAPFEMGSQKDQKAVCHCLAGMLTLFHDFNQDASLYANAG